MVSSVTRLGSGIGSRSQALPVFRRSSRPWRRASVKIGYALSRTGPNAGGAAVTTLPNYEMWVKEVNAAGGLKLGDKRVPIEVVQYDDRSSAEEAAKALDRLITQDKVDFILPPWGTGLNLAVGPILNKAGYPHLASTAVTDRAPELAKRWPNSFWLLGTSAGAANTLVELLVEAAHRGQDRRHRCDGQRRRRFRHRPCRPRRGRHSTKANFKLAYDKTYPVGTAGSRARWSTRPRRSTPTSSSPSAIRRIRSGSPNRRGSPASIRRSSTPASAPRFRCSRASSAPTPRA